MTNPPNKPKHVPNNSQAQLRQLYTDNEFGDLLPKCIRHEICPRRKRKPQDTFHAESAEYEEGVKYIDPSTSQSIAVIFWYTDIEGRTWETIRMLRVGDIIYDAQSRL
jgi:hypothetical protein